MHSFALDYFNWLSDSDALTHHLIMEHCKELPERVLQAPFYPEDEDGTNSKSLTNKCPCIVVGIVRLWGGLFLQVTKCLATMGIRK